MIEDTREIRSDFDSLPSPSLTMAIVSWRLATEQQRGKDNCHNARTPSLLSHRCFSPYPLLTHKEPISQSYRFLLPQLKPHINTFISNHSIFQEGARDLHGNDGSIFNMMIDLITQFRPFSTLGSQQIASGEMNPSKFFRNSCTLSS